MGQKLAEAGEQLHGGWRAGARQDGRTGGWTVAGQPVARRANRCAGGGGLACGTTGELVGGRRGAGIQMCKGGRWVSGGSRQRPGGRRRTRAGEQRVAGGEAASTNVCVCVCESEAVCAGISDERRG